MRILRVISSMLPSQGGPAQGIRNSIPEMSNHGIENEVVCFDLGNEAYCGTDNFKIFYLGPSKGPYSYSNKFSSWMKCNFFNYDVVIIHGLWLYNSYGTYKVWQSLKKQGHIVPRLYIMPHGMLDPYFQKASDRKIKALRNSIYWHLFEKKVINGVDGILFTCRKELELAQSAFSGYSPKKQINVTYGIQPPPLFNSDMHSAFLEKSGLKKGEPYILFLSRIHKKKGVDLLINAYLKIKLENHFKIPRLVIAGPINNRYSNELKNSVLGRNDIIFTEMLQGNAKWGAIYLCEAFILPSHQENFGIVVAEALACGKPVLITDKVNIYKEVLEADAGLVFLDTVKGIYEMLIEWFQINYERKKEMCDNATQVYLDKFSIENSVKETLYQLKKNN